MGKVVVKYWLQALTMDGLDTSVHPFVPPPPSPPTTTETTDFMKQELPLTRIKKIIKQDEEVEGTPKFVRSYIAWYRASSLGPTVPNPTHHAHR